MIGQLTLVDIRNWGIDEQPAGATALDRARWLADVMRRVCQLHAVEGLGSLQTTAGSQAMYTLRRMHLTHALFVHTNKEALDLESAAYYGGRCECRRLGVLTGPVYHLDFRSLYGSICAVGSLPALLAQTGEGQPALDARSSDGVVQAIAQVTIRTEEPAYPFRRDGLVVYPTGRFTTVLCGPELTDAMERGRIVHWHRWAAYVGTPCLNSYARHVLALLADARQAGDGPLCQYLKRLLVALPGKMGQRDWRWINAPWLRPPAPWCAWPHVDVKGRVTRCRALGRQCQQEEKGGWAPNAIPSIAAWVCSEGRVKLLAAIRVAGWQQVAYHDTDSLIVSARGYQRLRDKGQIGDGEPGRLRILGRHFHAEIRGIKSYVLDEQQRCAGAPGGSVEAGPCEAVYWFRQWLKSAVRSGRRPEPERALRRWQRTEAYRHGRVMADGRVEPWLIG